MKTQIDAEVTDFVDRNDSRWVMFGKWVRCVNAGNSRGLCVTSSTFHHWQPLNPDPISCTLHPYPVPRTLNPTSSSQITDSHLLIPGLFISFPDLNHISSPDTLIPPRETPNLKHPTLHPVTHHPISQPHPHNPQSCTRIFTIHPLAQHHDPTP